MGQHRERLSASVFDGEYESLWWPAARGKPTWYVLAGIWIWDAMLAGGITLLVGLVAFYALMIGGGFLGFIDLYETELTFPIAVCLATSGGMGLLAGRPFLRDAIRTTKLWLILRRHSRHEFEEALEEYERDRDQTVSPWHGRSQSGSSGTCKGL